MSDIRKTIRRLYELYERSSTGKWKVGESGNFVALNDARPGYPPTPGLIANLNDDEYISNRNKWDAKFIAEAHNAMPALLEYIEKLERVADAERRQGPYGRTWALQEALDELDRVGPKIAKKEDVLREAKRVIADNLDILEKLAKR